VKQFASGWMMINSANPQRIAEVRSAPDWPQGPMVLTKGGRVIVNEDRAVALADAQREYEIVRSNPGANIPASFEEFLAREIVGTPDECLDRLAGIESWGINYLRATFSDAAAQDRVARLLLPRLGEVEERLAAASNA
jgi:alkanesulfonate monooxygenase SsuD/methylene tetrahydromethanopterin reductase-like flavin-dependent oxidoreductase (luciferase family)